MLLYLSFQGLVGFCIFSAILLLNHSSSACHFFFFQAAKAIWRHRRVWWRHQISLRPTHAVPTVATSYTFLEPAASIFRYCTCIISILREMGRHRVGGNGPQWPPDWQAINWPISVRERTTPLPPASINKNVSNCAWVNPLGLSTLLSYEDFRVLEVCQVHFYSQFSWSY